MTYSVESLLTPSRHALQARPYFPAEIRDGPAEPAAFHLLRLPAQVL